MERRVLLAIFLSFLVIYAWQALFLPAPKPPADATATPVTAGEPSAAPGGKPPAATPQQPAAPATPVAAPVATLVGGTTDEDIRVETQEVIAVFTNRGARLKSWRLKGHSSVRREPLELIPQNVPPGKPLPFSLQVPDAGVTNTLNSALYSVTGAPAGGTAAQTSPVDLKFEYRDSAGVHAVKEFHFEPTSFVLTFRPTVSIGDKAVTPVIHWGPGLEDSEPIDAWWLPGGLLATEDDEERLTAANVGERPVYEAPYKFAGVDDHYFMSTVLNPGPVKVTFEPVTVPPPPGTEVARTLMAYSIEPARVDQPLKFYIGPKDLDQLAMVDRDLVRAINFGVFAVIVVPLLQSLKWINGYVGNYGWSILVLTAIINIIILPLRHKSVVSMRRMQEIQPEAKAIQDRYSKLKATDPAKQKMNQELMALYKERGVNPASGCVPMLIPFPVLIAFYSLLTVATELRGQPFMLWIRDLSAPDPYYVTPILMGASQLWQQWIAPAAGVDPIQRKMMMIMPVVFTFLFLGYPAGVALYWFASNLWAIGQQYGTNYLIGPPNIRTVRPPAERRLKRAGASKTEAAAREK
jgi:YidC/Oxa1 family membrane protein insertase